MVLEEDTIQSEILDQPETSTFPEAAATVDLLRLEGKVPECLDDSDGMESEDSSMPCNQEEWRVVQKKE